MKMIKFVGIFSSSFFVFFLHYFAPCYAGAAIVLQDGVGQTVTLNNPAKRIISLSPGITELIFAAGGGGKLVGVIRYSNFPESAKHIPVVGDSRELDLERIMTLKPDLLVVWRQGSSAKQIEQLRRLGVPLFFTDEHKLVDIPQSIRQLGQLMDTKEKADKAADDLDDQIRKITNRYAHLSPVRLFYQVWSEPLYTLNGQQIVSDAVRVCGGVNVFANQNSTAPNISIEAVLQKNPEAIIVTNEQNIPNGGIAMWKRFPTMTAVKQNNLFELDGNLINRASPRMLVGVSDLCEKLELARQHRR